MVRSDGFWVASSRLDYARVEGDFFLWIWYSVLKDYAKRFKKDRFGFTRVDSQVFEEDYNLDRRKVWRYNRKLEDKGLLVIDRVKRGGRTWLGFKLV